MKPFSLEDSLPIEPDQTWQNILSLPAAATIDIVSYEHNVYVQVVRDSRPFWLTNMLKSNQKWAFITCLLFVYSICFFQVITDNLLALKDVEPNDFFDFGDESTKKWFVDIKMGDVMGQYNEYLQTNFGEDKIGVNELTNIHAVTEKESHGPF